MKRLIPYLLSLSFLALSCQKEDSPVILPPPGPVQQLVAAMGSNYDDQVYVSLSKGIVHTAPYRAYDLMFEASATGYHIFLNSGKLMFACRTGNTDFFGADSVNASWLVDAEHLDGDSTAIGNWWSAASIGPTGYSEVFVIDRGRADHTGNDRFRKLQVLSADDTHYEIRFSAMDNSGLTVMNIPKNPAYSLMYLSFDNNGTLVQQAPPASDWDFVFTKYTHVYFDEPPGSPFRYYPVCGALLNKWRETTGMVMLKDSTPGYVPFADCAYTLANTYQFSTDADVIGFDWKYYDFGNSCYYITPDLYFVMKDQDGLYYKMRMVDYYDQNGNKGTITLQYQRM
ncbi:MAG: HmuY family protein [Bacteroidia bacterium]|nr:HmuY family protein [Bacteroidia bacterium]